MGIRKGLSLSWTGVRCEAGPVATGSPFGLTGKGHAQVLQTRFGPSRTDSREGFARLRTVRNYAEMAKPRPLLQLLSDQEQLAQLKTQ